MTSPKRRRRRHSLKTGVILIRLCALWSTASCVESICRKIISMIQLHRLYHANGEFQVVMSVTPQLGHCQQCRSTWNGTNSTRRSQKRSSTSSTDNSPTPHDRPLSDPSKSQDSILARTRPTSSSSTCGTSTATFSRTTRTPSLSRTTSR